jgi:hypothetical protein
VKQQLESIQQTSVQEKAQSLYKSLNGRPEFSDVIIEKWLKARDGDKTLEEVAGSFKTENPSYFTPPQTETVSTVPSVAGGKDKNTSQEKAIEEMRESAGLSPKKT